MKKDVGLIGGIVALLCIFSTAHATIWYVHPDSTLNSIQAGIGFCSTGDTVLVGPGTYIENINFNGMAITVTSEHGADTTIIDGSNPANPDTASVVLFINGEDTSSVLDGFTLTNGSGTTDPIYGSFGGGIYCRYNSSPTIIGNTIIGNSADWAGGILCWVNSSPKVTGNTITGNTAGFGGGIGCWENSSPTITGNTISGNTAGTDAGGITCSMHSSPTIIGNNITYNTASGGGGGIECWDYSDPTIISNTITDNTAGQGGGIVCWYDCSPTIMNNTIANNTAEDGGGITCYNQSSPTITGNFITNNIANSLGGGIMCTANSSPIIDSNIVTDHSATYGGGIACYTNSSPTITGNTISNNTAQYSAGGIWCTYGSSPDIIDNTITGNTAYGAGGNNGAGIQCYSNSSPSIKHCAISGNNGTGITCCQASPMIDSCSLSDNSYNGMYCYENSAPHINYCNIHGNAYYGVSNVSPGDTINAENNWWGDPSGPGGVGPGTGDSVSNYVDFTPWLQDSVEWVGIEEHEPSQPITTLLQISPNPFRVRVDIRWQIADNSGVNLKIYDATGRMVKDFKHVTNQQIFWNGTDDLNRNLPSGVYFLKFQAGDYSATEKLLLIR